MYEYSELMKVSEVKLSYKISANRSEMPIISETNEAKQLMAGLFDEDQIEYRESFCVAFLNKRHRVLGVSRLFDGGVSSCVVDQKVIFQHALLANASAIILAHNHPSGNIIPSSEDRQLTDKICKCGDILGIKILDHIIVDPDGDSFSFSENGLI